jgi:hypothetical protein
MSAVFICICMASVLLLLSCGKQNHCIPVDPPFLTVLKLLSAESFDDKEAARRYIDVEAVYSEIALRGGISADSLWRSTVDAGIMLARSSRKFTSHTPVYRYTVCEEVRGDSAIVVLHDEIVTDSSCDEYHLVRRGGVWVVVSIQYNKRMSK